MCKKSTNLYSNLCCKPDDTHTRPQIQLHTHKQRHGHTTLHTHLQILWPHFDSILFILQEVICIVPVSEFGSKFIWTIKRWRSLVFPVKDDAFFGFVGYYANPLSVCGVQFPVQFWTKEVSDQFDVQRSVVCRFDGQGRKNSIITHYYVISN